MEQGPPMEGGPGLRNSVSVPVVSNTIWRLLEILTKAAVIAESSVSAVKFFILCDEVTNI